MSAYLLDGDCIAVDGDAWQWTLFPARIGGGYHGDLHHAGDRRDRVLHVHRRDPLAAGLDQVAPSVLDHQVSVRAADRRVAGVKPAALEAVGKLTTQVTVGHPG